MTAPAEKPEPKIPVAHSTGTVGHVYVNGVCECGALLDGGDND